MLSKNFLSKTLTVVSTVALLGSMLTTNNWAMFSEEGELSHGTPISSAPNLQEKEQNLLHPRVIVGQQTIGFVQEIFDSRGQKKDFNDNMAREFFEDLGCKVDISYPGTDWMGNKRGKTMLSFGTGENEKIMTYHQGLRDYTINHCLRVQIKQFLDQINRTPENLDTID